MFNLGAPEIIIILIIALLVFGPQRLPEIGASLGRSIREFRRMSAEMTEGLTEEVQDLVQEVQEVSRELSEGVKEIETAVTEEAATISQVFTTAATDVQQSLTVPAKTESSSVEAPSMAVPVGIESDQTAAMTEPSSTEEPITVTPVEKEPSQKATPAGMESAHTATSESATAGEVPHGELTSAIVTQAGEEMPKTRRTSRTRKKPPEVPQVADSEVTLPSVEVSASQSETLLSVESPAPARRRAPGSRKKATGDVLSTQVHIPVTNQPEEAVSVVAAPQLSSFPPLPEVVIPKTVRRSRARTKTTAEAATSTEEQPAPAEAKQDKALPSAKPRRKRQLTATSEAHESAS